MDNDTYAIWMDRLDQMEDTMLPAPFSLIRRRKRGLFDFVGEASAKLFGTATTSQVEECRHQIELIENHNQRVTHVTDGLITIVNQTHEYTKENRQHIRHVQRYVASIADEVRYMEDILNYHSQQI